MFPNNDALHVAECFNNWLLFSDWKMKCSHCMGICLSIYSLMNFWVAFHVLDILTLFAWYFFFPSFVFNQPISLKWLSYRQHIMFFFFNSTHLFLFFMFIACALNVIIACLFWFLTISLYIFFRYYGIPNFQSLFRISILLLHLECRNFYHNMENIP